MGNVCSQTCQQKIQIQNEAQCPPKLNQYLQKEEIQQMYKKSKNINNQISINKSQHLLKDSNNTAISSAQLSQSLRNDKMIRQTQLNGTTSGSSFNGPIINIIKAKQREDCPQNRYLRVQNTARLSHRKCSTSFIDQLPQNSHIHETHLSGSGYPYDVFDLSNRFNLQVSRQNLNLTGTSINHTNANMLNISNQMLITKNSINQSQMSELPYLTLERRVQSSPNPEINILASDFMNSNVGFMSGNKNINEVQMNSMKERNYGVKMSQNQINVLKRTQL